MLQSYQSTAQLLTRRTEIHMPRTLPGSDWATKKTLLQDCTVNYRWSCLDTFLWHMAVGSSEKNKTAPGINHSVPHELWMLTCSMRERGHILVIYLIRDIERTGVWVWALETEWGRRSYRTGVRPAVRHAALDKTRRRMSLHEDRLHPTEGLHGSDSYVSGHVCKNLKCFLQEWKLAWEKGDACSADFVPGISTKLALYLQRVWNGGRLNSLNWCYIL